MAANIEPGHETADPALPTLSEVLGNARSKSLSGMTKKVVAAFEDEGHELEPLELDKWPKPLKGFVRLFRTKLPNPLVPAQAGLEYIIVVAADEWTSARTDAFIAAMAPLRLAEGLPIVHIYSRHPAPVEVSFLFETLDAGVLEISAWEIVEDEPPEAAECSEIAAAGRKLLRDIYYVDLDPEDLQWVSVVNQLIIEELRWFTDDPAEKIGDHIEYIPFASLLVLGCVAGETIRLNHEPDLLWADGDGDNWPRLGHVGSVATLAVIEEALKRFELGESRDIWEMYQAFYEGEQLSPPHSFQSEAVNPLDFLPDWEPGRDDDLDETAVDFVDLVRQAKLDIKPHPVHARDSADAEILARSIRAFTCTHEDKAYDLILCTKEWTDELTRAFARTYGHYAMTDWELGLQPTFVFFTAYPLSPVVAYSFVHGPTVGPLEGLARVETPAPVVSELEPEVIRTLAHWLLALLEQYTTIGLELSSYSVLPGLEFFLKEDLAQPEAEDEGEAFDYVPEALLVAVGLTAGEHMRLAARSFHWVHKEGCQWPVMEIEGREGSTFDWVATARAIWSGKREDFGWRSSWSPRPVEEEP